MTSPPSTKSHLFKIPPLALPVITLEMQNITSGLLDQNLQLNQITE
jgi:hypothetical protein